MLSSYNSRRCCFIALTCVLGLLIAIGSLLSFEDETNNPDYFRIIEPTIPGPSTAWNRTTTISVEEESVSTLVTVNQDTLPWYIDHGLIFPEPAPRDPSGRRIAKLWPDEDPDNDRIENQLMFLPPDYEPPEKLKKILIFNEVPQWSEYSGFGLGRLAFLPCPVHTCSLTTSHEDAGNVDAIMFKNIFKPPVIKRPPKQVWIFHVLESPHHTEYIKHYDLINWTVTYRHDSDIVFPYGKWLYYNPNITEFPGPLRDFAANKTDLVAWFVSNCNAPNGRLRYVHELQRYIQVDIYGACGSHTCPRKDAKACFELLEKKYKFYLAFENSNCKEYITEKLFVNSLKHDILPIVMGARPEDYAKAAPQNSYIHVDDFESPKHLAEFLLRLDKNNDLYNSYFRWKGTGEFIKHNFFCRLCAMLHDDYPEKNYENINEWWGRYGTCTSGSWHK